MVCKTNSLLNHFFARAHLGKLPSFRMMHVVLISAAHPAGAIPMQDQCQPNMCGYVRTSSGKCAIQWMEGNGVHRVDSISAILIAPVALEGIFLGLHMQQMVCLSFLSGKCVADGQTSTPKT